MYVDDTTTAVRTLAKSSHYQTLFAFMKEGPFKVFENTTNLTSLQLDFLSYLSFYHSIQMDIYMGDVVDRVMNNFVYEDAYCIYRNEKRKKPTYKEYGQLPRGPKSPDSIHARDQWIFKSRPKRK